MPTAICRRPGSTPAGASNIAITPTSAPSATARNMTACSNSARRCRKLRRRVEQDLKRRKLTRDTVLAAVVRLLDTEHIRIGNEEYAHDRTRASARPRCEAATFAAQGPDADDALHRQARHRPRSDDHRHQPEAHRASSCQELPGPDAVPVRQRRRRAAGRSPRATSTTISAKATGGDFTAKHFRTWSASVIALRPVAEKGARTRGSASRR